MKFAREFYRPLGWSLVDADEKLGLEVYRKPGQLVAMGFAGKRSRPDFHYKFRTEERLKAECEIFGKRIRDAASAKIEHAEKKRAALAGHNVKTGDIFRASWGYDQTNIDFYEVVSVSGCMATVHEIGAHSVATESMQGYACRFRARS